MSGLARNGSAARVGYFDLYHSTPCSCQWAAAVWAQYAQGAAHPRRLGGFGIVYLDPRGYVYTLNCDCTCYP